jgi:hypothetical protein
MFESVAVFDPEASEAMLVERISAMERMKSAAAADQARATAALDEKRRRAEADADVPAGRRGKGLASEVGLARHDSPHRGAQHLNVATTLVRDMPHTLAALEAGALSEWRATLIVKESACLTAEDRRALDAELCADRNGLAGLGDARITRKAKSIAYRLDSEAAVERAKRAPNERRVTIRPAADAMAYLTALLPMAQGMSVHAALAGEADTNDDDRTRGQVMADTLVERITGQAADSPTPIAVNLVITDETLLDAGTEPARVVGYGPIPAGIARQIVHGAVIDPRSGATLRRLYRQPTTGALVAMESRARLFPTALAAFIALRDDICRTPYCNAPIRHTDHADPHTRGGPTNEVNGLGMCEQCNYAKQARGWSVVDRRDGKGRHTAEFTTPTGDNHHSQAPPLPGRFRFELSRIEARMTVDLTTPKDVA